MPAAQYEKTSPYYTTEMYGQYLDILEYRDIPKLKDDVLFTINKTYQYRPDLLAFDLYGDAHLWWVFVARNPNVLKDPLFDFDIGVGIYIPKKDNIISALGI